LDSETEKIVIQFNNYINSQNLKGLENLMTDNHTFIDSINNSIKGKENCIKAWSAFFKAFPDYQNHFTALHCKDNTVFIEGNSICSDKRLDGPALWTAQIENDKISEWRVYEDSEESRTMINMIL
jgi:ketosteroid isomerase-like protein